MTSTELRALLAEVTEAYIDACWQGTGNEPMASPGWHNFLSTYEYANTLIPRLKAALATKTFPMTDDRKFDETGRSRQLVNTPCPVCDKMALRLDLRLVAKPMGSFSLAGHQLKVPMTYIPWLVCDNCGVEAKGKPDDD